MLECLIQEPYIISFPNILSEIFVLYDEDDEKLDGNWWVRGSKYGKRLHRNNLEKGAEEGYILAAIWDKF